MNIVLIGMPSSGKTTVGKPLANRLGMGFIDTDAVIREKENRELSDIVNKDGLQHFLHIQETALMELQNDKYVISTGGSAVYSDKAMKHLKKNSIIIYLKVKYEDIENRITGKRRFARNSEQTLLDLYNERTPLYEKYKDLAIDCTEKTAEDITEEIAVFYEKTVLGGQHI